MDFIQNKKHIRKVSNDKYIIGTRPLDPLLTIDGKKIIVDNISSNYFFDSNNSSGEDGYVLTSTANGVEWKESTGAGLTKMKEAFEEDENGEITPTIGEDISDTMWILNDDDGEFNLELRANLWRYNQGTAAVLVKDENGDIVIEEADDFPEDISF